MLKRVSFFLSIFLFSDSNIKKKNLPPTCSSTTLQTTASNPSNAASSSPPPDEPLEDTDRALRARPSTSSAYAAANGVPYRESCRFRTQRDWPCLPFTYASK